MKKVREYSDLVNTILGRPLNGKGGGTTLRRGEAAMLFLDGYRRRPGISIFDLMATARTMIGTVLV
jgi:hypothetical protein